MAQKNDYRAQVDLKRTEHLRELLKHLPGVCRDYFLSVTMTTSTLTRLAYAYDFRIFFDYLCKENPIFADTDPYLITPKLLDVITATDIAGYQEYLTHYYTTDAASGDEKIVQNSELGIMRKLCSIRSLFEFLFKNKYISANVTTLIDLPKHHEKPILRLERDEMERLLQTVDSGDGLSKRQKAYAKFTGIRDKAIITLFLGTGIRVSECVGLDITDIDFELNAFAVTRKGGNQAILYFPDEVADALKEYLAQRDEIEALPGHENAFFLSMQKRRITQRAVENLVKKYALIAAPLKKRISPHKLRSTFGTNLYQESGDIYLVADVLGHSDVNTTRKHYAAMTDSRRRMAAGMVKLGAISANNDNNDEKTEEEPINDQ
ncbi:MAG: integrase [Clostridiales bacterium]|nr:integrase [Clostridiales bacterium]